VPGSAEARMAKKMWERGETGFYIQQRWLADLVIGSNRELAG